MRHLYIDDLSRNVGANGAIAGCGIAMTADTSTSHNFGKEGHYARNCHKEQANTIKKCPETHEKQENNNLPKGKVEPKSSSCAEVVFSTQHHQ